MPKKITKYKKYYIAFLNNKNRYIIIDGEEFNNSVEAYAHLHKTCELLNEGKHRLYTKSGIEIQREIASKACVCEKEFTNQLSWTELKPIH